jgi:hypothetical protein
MRRIRLTWPSPAMVIALLALALSIAGTGYAASRLPPRSVGSRELKNKAVSSAKIKPRAVTSRTIARNAVDGSKVANNSLTGADIDEATLAIRGRTDPASGNTVHASSAAALDALSYPSARMTLPPGGANTKGRVACPAHQHVVGGGMLVDDPTSSVVVDSHPDGPTAWAGTAANVDPTATQGASVFAICVMTIDAG